MNESNFAFAHPEYFTLLYALIGMVLLFVFARYRTKKRLDRIADSRFYNTLMPNMALGKKLLRFIILCFAGIALVFAIARPQFGLKLQEVTQKGIEVVIALDVSNSMLAEDIKPSRIERAKLSIQRLLDNLHEDKVAVVVFAGDAYTLLPLTHDISSAKMMTHTIKTDFIGRQGTSVGAAIQRGLRSFTDDPLVEKTIILISDGEDHEQEAIEQAKQAQERGIRIHTIGMGSEQGAPIPRIDAYGRRSFMQDRSGRVVTTRLNEQLLQEIAQITGGSYARADFSAAIEAISSMTKAEFDTKKYSEYDEKFQYFIAIAILLLLLECVFLERKNKWLQKYSLFKQ